MLTSADMFLSCCLLFFAAFGCFGNANIIWATCRRRELQNKCGYLLATLAFCDFACLMFELWSAIRLLTESASMHRFQCYWSQFPYITFCNLETYMILIVAFDRQLAIQFSLRYQNWGTPFYMSLLIVPGICYGLAFEIFSYKTLDNPVIEMCNLPSGMSDQLSDIWVQLSTLFCVVTVLIYAANFIILHKYGLIRFKSQNQLDQNKKILHTLSINVICFFFSSVACNTSILIFKNNGASSEVVDTVVKFAVIPGLLSYSANYYIYFWRSSEYKRAFTEQIHMLLSHCGCKQLIKVNRKPSQPFTTTTVSVQVSNAFTSSVRK